MQWSCNKDGRGKMPHLHTGQLVDDDAQLQGAREYESHVAHHTSHGTRYISKYEHGRTLASPVTFAVTLQNCSV